MLIDLTMQNSKILTKQFSDDVILNKNYWVDVHRDIYTYAYIHATLVRFVIHESKHSTLQKE